jgi:hypothetical protein
VKDLEPGVVCKETVVCVANEIVVGLMKSALRADHEKACREIVVRRIGKVEIALPRLGSSGHKEFFLSKWFEA